MAMVANRLVPLGGFVCDHVDGTASFAAKGRKAAHTKGAEAGERYYGMAYVKTFLDGLSGYSRVWRVTAPQYDPDWYDTIWALQYQTTFCHLDRVALWWPRPNRPLLSDSFAFHPL